MELLVLEQLEKSYANKFCLKIDKLVIHRGEIHCLIGSNGAGKSTLQKIVCGLLPLDHGTILLDGKSIQKISNLGDYIGYVQQSKGLPEEITVYEYLYQQAILKDVGKKEILSAMDLADITKHKNTYIGHLSEGTKRKIHILSAILHRPALLILDEPTVGIDLAVSLELIEYFMNLRDAGFSLLITTHHLDEVKKMADVITIMDDGRIVYQASYQDIKEQSIDRNSMVLTLREEEKNYLLEEQMNKMEYPYIKSIMKMKNDYLVTFIDKEKDYLPELVNALYQRGLCINSLVRYKIPFEKFFLDKLNK